MKILIFLFFLLPATCFAQMVGIAGQWADFRSSQFVLTGSLPYLIHMGDKTSWCLSAGADYVTGNPKVSGLNLKPASFYITTSEIYSRKKYTAMLGLDAGYNFNFEKGNDGIMLTPNLYLDYNVLYIKTGYDYNASHNEGQFFIRLGVGLGRGFFKMLKGL